ncbi:serine/threonine protein kinase [Halopseudomonas salegens]|uniref:Serine/threonine protein kinase n=1 Tax=Halopseudomonas salegens TaxID=1434072 RepID=A0A1H2E0D5_9GAMM|nr:serine/threonine-protein kinase [Halopseudomonas salegens]SDT88527.1 Serine/threonine protein kinase [Halopseudomonas salegens]
MDASSTARSSLLDMDSAGNPDAPCVNALPSGTRLKEFELLSPLGQGGFSIVYAAMDTALQRPVAVKEYMPSSFASRADSSQVILRSQRHKSSFDAGMNSFIEEARLLAQFKHPALVEVLSFWEENGTAYMVMPLYSGKTLRQTLRDQPGCANEVWLKGLIAPILDVLELLHEQQIYHRDIAPDNIIIKLDGLPVLLDLGSARKVVTDSEHAPTVVVKPGYAPIEQYAEDKSVPQGPWTDIYALGALLYYSVTGRAPSASVSRMMKDSLQPLSDQPLTGYSREFLAAIDLALALQPADRPQSIREFRDALEVSNLSKSQAQMARAVPADSNPEYLDEEKTVILSAADLEQLLQGDAEPDARTDAGEYQDVFSAQEPQQETHAFADMDEFLNPPTPQSLGTVSVPESHAAASVQAVSDNRKATGNRPSNRRLLAWAAAVVSGTLSVTLLIAAILTSQNEDQPASVLADVPQPDVEAPIDVAVASDEDPEPSVDQMDTTAGEALFFDVPRQPEPPFADPFLHSPVPYETAGEDALLFSALSQEAQQGAPGLSNEDFLFAEAQEGASNPGITLSQASEPPPVVTASPRPGNTSRPQATSTPARAERNTAPEVATGKIALNVLPWGEVWVDGELMGITPPLRELQLPVGQRSIEIRNPGFSSLTHSIEVNADRVPLIAHEFISGAGARNLDVPERSAPRVTEVQQSPRTPRTPAQPQAPATPANTDSPAAMQFGFADLRVSPWAEVWVNGEMQGIAPPLNELRLPEGEHIIEFRNQNAPVARQTVTISSARRAVLVQTFD